MKHLDFEQVEMFGSPEYQRSVYIPSDPVEPQQVNEEATIGTGQYGDAVQVAESDDSSAQISLPFMFGQVSNSAPGYDFSGMFGSSKDPAPASIIERVVAWVRSLLS
jgi:hypothetical protein